MVLENWKKINTLNMAHYCSFFVEQ